MTYDLWPTTRELLDVLSSEVARCGGSVSNTFDNGTCLYARAVLPATREVARGDRLQGGVSLRANPEGVCVHPYVFRQVCSNGAIFAQVVGTRVILRDECAFDVPAQVAEAVGECCRDEAFAEAATHMHSAMSVRANAMLNLAPFLSRLPKEHVQRFLRDVMAEFREGKDRSRYGLMNAVTATARETRDPELRWRMEELGGAVAVITRDPVRPDGAHVVPPAPVEAELTMV
jgi:hypothetical protein